MGTAPSVEIQSPSDFKYFAVQFGHSDRLRLISAQFEVIKQTKNVIESYWRIQTIHESPGFVEFKIEGMPWLATGKKDTDVKHFLCKLIRDFYEIGWHLKITSDLIYSGTGSDVVLFERKSRLSTPVICLSLNDTDRIRIVAEESVISYNVRVAIKRFWSQGIQHEQWLGKSYEFKLKGNPWAYEQSESTSLMNGILSNLYNIGWVFVSAIDSGNKQYNLNSLYFRFDRTETSKPENLNSRFFALTLNRTDRMQLINAELDLETKLTSKIDQFWPNGLELGLGCFLVLKGTPWLPKDNSERVSSRALVSNLISFFSQNNWNLYATCILTNSVERKSSFFFRYSEKYPVKVHCISLNETDKIRFIGDHRMAVDKIRDSINKNWSKGIQKEKEYYHGSWQFKLKGNPFTHYGSDSIYACYLMMNILDELESKLGLKLISSADVSGEHIKDSKNEYPISPLGLDSWYFEQKL
jgi:hypothetical protein